MPLKMGKGNKYIRVHHRTAYFSLGHVFSVFDRDVYLVRSFKSVRDNYMATGGKRGKPVEICGIHMIERIFSPADIQSIAIG